MAVSTKFPRTNEELAELGGGQPVRFKGTEDEYWKLLEEVEYRVDFYKGEIIASMSYESDIHSDIANELMFLLKTIFRNRKVRFGNSNRPVCIPACDHAVFNPDGSVIGLPDKFYEYRPGMNAELTPIVLFEILSNSTRIRDWGEKLPCYKQTSTLEQILYVDTERIRTHVIQRQEDPDQWLETIYEKAEDNFTIADQVIHLREIYRGTLVK